MRLNRYPRCQANFSSQSVMDLHDLNTTAVLFKYSCRWKSAMIREQCQKTWSSHDPVMGDVGKPTRRLRNYGSLGFLSTSFPSVSPSVYLASFDVILEILLMLIECRATSFLSFFAASTISALPCSFSVHEQLQLASWVLIKCAQ